ncbi:MAG: hypothetical protein HFE81_04285 [Bacilli bacterium]|nr:hypothetical protein [Bacilli bacterium]MCI8919062.1 hypothetical protein [Eubacterium sp.]
MKSNKKDNKKKIFIIVVAILAISIILYLIISSSDKTSEEEKILKKEGYTTEKEDAFYKKIVTNNSLDDYYNDVSHRRESQYEEYYVSKDSNDFIELKLSYYKGVDTTLNILSNLSEETVNYNYELAYKDAHLILEGNDNEANDCKVVLNENISQDTINTYCDMIKNEIKIFTDRKDELLKNKKINTMVK